MSIEIIIIPTLIAIFLIWQLYPIIHARRQRGQNAPDISPLLNSHQKNISRILVYFWGPHCSMCKSTSAIIDQLLVEHSDIVKVDISEHRDIAIGFGVLASPSIAVVDHGQIENLYVGPKSKKQIETFLATKN